MQSALPTSIEPSLNQLPGINQIAFSPDGTRCATGDTGMRVRIERNGKTVVERDLRSTSEKARTTERVRGLGFSHDGKLLYVAAGERLRALSSDNGAEKWAYSPPRSFGFLVISPVGLATTGDQVAACFDNGSMAVWSPEGRMRAIWHDNDSPRYLSFLGDGNRLVGCDSFSVCVWDPATRRRLMKLRLPDRVYGLSVSPTANIAATRTLYSVQLWDLDLATMLSQVPVGQGLPIVAFHPERQWLAVADKWAVNLVDFSGRFIDRYDCGPAAVLSLAFRPDGRTLAVGGSDGQVRTFEVNP
jgi:WD40 repeat protein